MGRAISGLVSREQFLICEWYEEAISKLWCKRKANIAEELFFCFTILVLLVLMLVFIPIISFF